MSPEPTKPDPAAAAHRKLDQRLKLARDERLTGSVTVTVHVKDGAPNGVAATVAEQGAK